MKVSKAIKRINRHNKAIKQIIVEDEHNPLLDQVTINPPYQDIEDKAILMGWVTDDYFFYPPGQEIIYKAIEPLKKIDNE